MLNVCYPNFANQTTPRKFAPLWPECKLPTRLKSAVEMAEEVCDADLEDMQGLMEGEEMDVIDKSKHKFTCVKEAVQQAGTRYLGAGYSRAGFSYGACVVKVAFHPEGIDANRGEWEAWQKIGRNFSTIFAPVHDHSEDFSWITQPRLVPISKMMDTWKGENKGRRLGRDLDKRMEEAGILCGDVHYGNIGVRAGKAADTAYLYDYGFGLKCAIRTPAGERKITIRGAPGP